MKFLIVAMLLAVANAGVLPHAGQIEQEVIPGVANEHIVQGPSTKTRLIGPDGSQINAAAPGGTILPDQHVIAVAPVVEVAQPVLPLIRTVIEPIVPVVPAVQTFVHSEPVVAVSGPVVEAKSLEGEHEGQYVPDNTEQLYDDGSYKPSAEEESNDGGH